MMTLSDATNEFKLDDVPSDLISSINFGPSSSQFLLSSSWDHTVRLFDVTNNTSRMKYELDAPVLDCCFQDQLHCWSGDLLGHLKTMDFNSNELLDSCKDLMFAILAKRNISGTINLRLYLGYNPSDVDITIRSSLISIA
ncbi:mitotic checkpoint protein BUB3 [Trichonephila clavipes]|nr:mitotic checkpoint protein BUB3 [Trichonephila clavipes]